MTQINLELYQEQVDFVTAPEHALAFVAGIGSGKTYAGVVRDILATQGQIGGQRVPVPNVGVVTAPTYNMLKDATLRTFMEIAGPLVAKFNKADMVATMTNGSEVLFRSADNPERLRGPNILWWHPDEGALQTALTLKIMIGRLRQFGMYGWWWLTTTPKGRDWIHRRFVQEPQGNERLFTVPTWRNPFLSEEFIQSLLREYEGDFALQEIEGVFISHEGLIYPEFSRMAHVVTELPDLTGTVYAGMDFGYTNPGVIQVAVVDGDGDMVVVHEEYKRRRSDEDWVRVAKDLRDTWNIETFFCDPSGADYIKDMRKAGLPAIPANNSVDTGIQTVRNRLIKKGRKGRRLRFSASCVNALAEFEQYQWKKGRDGTPLEEPVKANDHAMDALRYLVMGVDKGAGYVIDAGSHAWGA